MSRADGLVVLGAWILALSPGCGSEDTKKKDPNKPYVPSGGESGSPSDTGEGASPGTSAAGTPTADGMGGSGDPGGSATGGEPTTTLAGATSVDAGAGPGPIECDPGFGDCDEIPDNGCEKPLNLVTACGDCNTRCDSTNGAAVCTDGQCVLTCASGFDDCDGKPDNGCETSLVDNDQACGSCQRNCTANGSTCATNVCDTIPLLQNVTIGLDGGGERTWAYSPFGLLHNWYSNYSIARLPLDGKPAVSLWASGSKTSAYETLLVIDDDAYWGERGNPTVKFSSIIYTKPILEAASTLPTPVFSPEFAAVYLRRLGGDLYWTSGGYQEEAVNGGVTDIGGFIYTRALAAPETDHGTRVMSVNQGVGGAIRQFNVTADAFYWVTSSAGAGTAFELRTAPLAGSPVSIVPEVFSGFSVAISTGARQVALEPLGDYIYFQRDVGDSQDGIYRYKTGLAKPERLALASVVTSLKVDAKYVYFTRANHVWRAPINDGAGGAAEQMASTVLTKIIAVDDSYVYAATFNSSQSDYYKIIK